MIFALCIAGALSPRFCPMSSKIVGTLQMPRHSQLVNAASPSRMTEGTVVEQRARLAKAAVCRSASSCNAGNSLDVPAVFYLCGDRSRAASACARRAG